MVAYTQSLIQASTEVNLSVNNLNDADIITYRQKQKSNEVSCELVINLLKKKYVFTSHILLVY